MRLPFDGKRWMTLPYIKFRRWRKAEIEFCWPILCTSRLCWILFASVGKLETSPLHQLGCSVDQAGWKRTEAGESAPSRHEDSPRPGRTKCELCETLQDLIMGAGKEASINLPCLLILASSWTASPSHSYSSELQATRGTLCCAAILPF